MIIGLKSPVLWSLIHAQFHIGQKLRLVLISEIMSSDFMPALGEKKREMRINKKWSAPWNEKTNCQFKFITLHKSEIYFWISLDLSCLVKPRISRALKPDGFKWKENTTAEMRRLSNTGIVKVPLMETEPFLLSLMPPPLISVCISRKTNKKKKQPNHPDHEWTQRASKSLWLFL